MGGAGAEEPVLVDRDRVERLLGDVLRTAWPETDDRDSADRVVIRSRHDVSVTTAPLSGSHLP